MSKFIVDESRAGAVTRALSIAISLAGLAIGQSASTASAADYTWNTGSGTWITGADWSTDGTVGTIPGTTSADTVTLPDTNGANNTVTLSANETIASLTFAQASSGTNELMITGNGTPGTPVASTLTVTSPVTVGGNSTGTELLFLNGAATGGTLFGNPIFNGSLSIDSNGILELEEYNGTGGGSKPSQAGVTGSISINNGGTMNVDTEIGSGDAGIYTINANISLASGGALNLGTTNSLGLSSTGTSIRFDINGNLTTTGGTIKAIAGTNQIYLTGTSTGASFGAGTTFVGMPTTSNALIWSGSNSTTNNAFTLASDVYLPFTFEPDPSAIGVVNNVTLEPVTTGGTMQVMGVQIGTPNKTGTTQIIAGGNITTGNINALNNSIGAEFIINPNGYTILDTAYVSGTSVGVSQTTTANMGSSNQMWVIQGGGTFKAPNINMNGGGAVSVGANTTLQVYGTGTTNLSSGTIGGGSTTIDPTSTLLFTGSYTGESYVTSTRTIGRLAIGDGSHGSIFGVSTTNLALGGDITVLKSGTFDLNGFNATEGFVTGGANGGLNGAGVVVNNATGTAATLTLDTTGGNGSFSGSINDHGTGTGTVAVTVGGSGIQTLSGINGYSGGTTVNGNSTLIISGSLTGSGAVNVNSGAILGGGGKIASAVNILSNGTLYPGTGGGANAVNLNLQSTLTLGISANVAVNLASSGTMDEIKLAGALSLGGNDTVTVNLLSAPVIGTAYDFLATADSGASLSDFVSIANLTGTYAGQYVGTVDYDSTNNAYDVTFAAVPEPDTWAMLIASTGMLVFMRRRFAVKQR